MLDLIAFGIVLPLLPAAGARYETHAVLIGALVALDSCFAFLLAPWWGRLSDRIGRRPVILIGLAGSALGYGLFAVAPSFLVLLLSRAVTGMTSTTFGVAQAALADVTTPERRARAMGLLGAAFGVGFTVGPAIGGIAGRLDDGLPALVAAAIAAGNFLLGCVLVPETRTSLPGPSAPTVLPALTSAEQHERRRLLVAAFGTTFAFSVMYVIFPLWCQQALGWPRPRVSSTYAVLGLVTIIVQGRIVGRLVPRFGDGPIAAAGALCLAAALALLPFVQMHLDAPWRTAAEVVALVTLLATGFSLTGPALAARMSRLGPTGAQGGVLGTLASAGSMGRIVGPPIIGLLSEAGGFGLAYGVAAAAALAGLVVLQGPRGETSTEAFTWGARRSGPSAPR